MALTGRLSNTSYMGFQYSVENIVDHLTTTGITAIPGERSRALGVTAWVFAEFDVDFVVPLPPHRDLRRSLAEFKLVV
ncbi:hypothetical protein Tco_0379349 [Tanacetum coccineum]